MSDLLLTEEIVDAYSTAKLMRAFKQICDDLNHDKKMKNKVLSLFRKSSDDVAVTKAVFKNNYKIDLDENDAVKMSKCLKAYFRKSDIRKPISEDIKQQLFQKQGGKCSICKKDLNSSNMHIDHIIPFKYVGDELDNNYQALCDNCNLQKNASVDYYFRSLIGLI